MQFRTKARAVDLLGKGQIADLPTAITELWKNGYDAYADTVTAEIFLKDYKGISSPLFMMTDDGKGMSKNDILDKWLVLGTDSKSRIKNNDEEGFQTLWKQPRIKAGEKGIGRLSVAYLGNPMLMLTKKVGHPLQALFFDWRLLENYNFFLEDVQLPVIDIENKEEFRDKFNTLKEDFLSNFEIANGQDGSPIWEQEQEKLKIKIIESVNKIIIPEFFEDEVLEKIISKENHGTKFLIFEPEDQILDLINKDSDDNDPEFLRSSLAGFTNQFKENKLPITFKFWIHKAIGKDYDLFNSEGNFFNHHDYKLADIIIDGKFSGTGSFSGQLTIFDEHIDYNFSNPRKDRTGDYGEIPIKLGYSMGLVKDSKLSDKLYTEINNKVEDYGGLYIYRDGFRVLPYGRPDADFLNFELRRSKRAGSYFFSYRRMFGYIELERNKNEKLKDKSSREGLINNSAYRALKNDLVAFFIEIANQYFSSIAKQSLFLDKKAQLNKRAEAIKIDKERTTKEKVQFTKDLKKYPEQLKNYQKQYKSLLEQLEKKLDQEKIVYSELESLLKELEKLDIEYKELIPEIPKTYQPTDLQLDRLEQYEEEIKNFNETIKDESRQLREDVRSRLEIKDLQIEFENNTEEYKASLETIIHDSKQKLNRKINYLTQEFDDRSSKKMKEVEFQKNKILDSIQSKKDVLEGLKKIKNQFESLREQIEKEITPLVDHINKLDFDIDEDLLQGAYKAEYENIKYQWEQTRETAQLGIAVEIIDHEFNVLYSQINSAIEKLSGNISEENLKNFISLKSFFKNLEDKYALLSPLYRVSGVSTKKIECKSIYSYLNKFFEKQFQQEGIQLEATNSFINHSIEIKEPVIHTVFINIINNAIYWLRNSERKEIRLDYLEDKNEILIINSGLKIEKHRLKKIFDLFYSNRPNGRGIGLYLSKQSLNENYYDLYATNEIEYNQLNGACFVISKELN